MNNQHRFEDALAAVTPRRTADLERMHLQKFQDERIRQSRIAAQVISLAVSTVPIFTGAAGLYLSVNNMACVHL